MARINCRMGPRSILVSRAVRMARAAVLLLPRLLRVPRKPEVPRRAVPEGLHHPADGWRAPHWLGCLPAVADLRVTASRLPHDSGTNVLSGCQPGRDGFFGDGAAGAPVRPDSQLEPDDVDEFVWQLDYHLAVRPGFEHRCR